MPVWLKRFLFGLLGIFIVLPLSGVLFQAIATQVDTRQFPPPGRLVDVGGYRLHLYCLGQNTDGRPTVILETGLGGSATSSDWAWIQPQVAKVTRVCAYDRAGLGWSDPGPQPRDGQQIAKELHNLLHNSQTPGPYVLAGWSFGGLYVRAYANQYPEEVAGLVLIDSSSPEQCTATPEWEAQCASSASNASRARFLAVFGVMRLIGLFQPATGLPGPQNAALLASFSSSKDWDAQNAEFQTSSAPYAEVRTAKPLGVMPLFVLTATDHGAAPDLERQWQVWQAGFTSLSTNSVQRVIPGATHESLVFNQADAQITAQAILQVVEAAHTGKWLNPSAPSSSPPLLIPLPR